MAYPKKLNQQYKQEKTDGLTTAKSFPEWYTAYQVIHQEPETVEPEMAPVEEVVEQTETTPEVATPVKEPKTAHARQLYDEMQAAYSVNGLELKRKYIIHAFMTYLPISKVGAQTYLQNIKLKKGLVNHK